MKMEAPTPEEILELRKRRIEYCKKSSKFILTNLGLGLLMVIYTIVGAIVFQKLETTNEKELCSVSMNKYDPLENQTANNLWSMAISYTSRSDGYEDELNSIQQEVIEFRNKVMQLGYDGTNCSALGEPGGPQYKWSFSGSLLFAVTVFTTVGYGNIAPKTMWGRLVCIVYAFIGIPLMLVFLANIGGVMADVFRFMYSTICCCGCCSLRKSSNSESKQNLSEHTQHGTSEDANDFEEDQLSVPLTVTLTVVAGYLFMGSLLFGTWENWSMLQSAYYCFITISTIGFGDVVPGTDNINSTSGQLTMIGAALYLIFGMAIMSMAFNLIQEEMVSKFIWISEKLGLSKKDDDDDEEELTSASKESQFGTHEPSTSDVRDANSLTKFATAAISQPTKK